MRIAVIHTGSSSLAGSSQRFDATRITLGRRPDNQVVFDAERDRAVSGHHAAASIVDGRIRLEDLGAQNGTWVNGARIAGPTVVSPTDTIRLGQNGPELRLQLEAASGSTPAPAPGAGAPAASVPGKTGIGQVTLERALDRATLTERKRSRGSLIAVTVVLLLAFGTALGGYAVHARSRDAQLEEEQKRLTATTGQLTATTGQLATTTGELGKKVEEAARIAQEARAATEKQLASAMARYDDELKAMKGKISDGEGKAARLMVELQERDQALADIRKRQDLSEEERKRLVAETESTMGSLREQLDAQQADLRKASEAGREDWSTLVERLAPAMFLMVVQMKPDAEGRTATGTGTCFCIRADGLLATNSHVAEMLKEQDKIAACVLVQNVTGKMYPPRRFLIHPEYTTPNSPDVALIQIKADGATFPAFELASDDELRALRIGTHLGTLGYPGELTAAYLSAIDPETRTVKGAGATFKDGWIGRILDFRYQMSSFENAQYIQHSASLSGGTSGSPVFTADGKVVMVHNSGMDVKGQVDRTPSAAEICFGIRSDVLRTLIGASGW